MDDPILSVANLRTHFQSAEGVVRAVDGVSFTIGRGETLGIVGESGSGKSATGLSLMRLVPEPGHIVEGSIKLSGVDLLLLPIGEMRKIRGRRMAMIFQDATSSLNPFLKVSTQLAEATRLHLGHSRSQARGHAIEMLSAVGIPDAERRMDDRPHEFSGGMRQRVMIAMALSCNPELLIADEPTTALDVTIQAQILDLIKEQKVRTRTSVVLVTHDLGLVAGMADKVIGMYAGKVFEQASTAELFSRPANPYTRGLLKCIPALADTGEKELFQIPGMPPDGVSLSAGCPFADRCDRAEDICRREFPPYVHVADGHYSLCHFAAEF